MSDKPLNVDEIMVLVDRHAIALWSRPVLTEVAEDLRNRIRAELEKLTKAAAEDDLFPCCSRRPAGDGHE